MAEAVLGTAVKAIQNEQKSDEEPVLQLKDFVWDQFLKYISSAILALTILNLSVEFLRGGGVLCFPPTLTKDLTNETEKPDELVYEFTVRQVDYFNGYCSRSIPASEFFPLYILVHGILLIAPHFIWSAVFKGDFDSFFAVTRKLDRLRDRKTGEYDPTNFDRVEKLEIEFGGRRRKIFLLYIAKLILQLLVCIGSYLFSAAFFINFSSSFDCPRDFSESDIPDRWPLNTTIPCVYTSLRILSLVRYADYILLSVAVILILLGLLWCAIRHTKELGHRDIANFVFQSCLSTKTYVFPPFHEIRRNQHPSDNCWFCCFPFALLKIGCRGCIGCQLRFMLFSPRIKNDLDFFEMYLFRADTSHGRVFKEIQIDKILRKMHGEDHQLLHLFLDAQRDMNAQMEKREREEKKRRSSQASGEVGRGESVSTSGISEQAEITPQPTTSPVETSDTATAAPAATAPPLSRVRDLDAFFKMGPGGFSRNPETFAFVHLQKYLSNIKWRPVEGIRDRLYGFVTYSPKHVKGPDAGKTKTNMALDISFGSSGYALVLARAFRKVISVNFHPFFRNEEETVKKKAFYTNYVDVNMPVDIFTQEQKKINEATEKMFEHMRKPTERRADFIVIGPLAEESQIVTVTLTIEQLHTVKLIEEGSILLAVRPLQIGHRNMTSMFCKYEPPIELFDHSFHTATVAKDIWKELGEEAEIMVSEFPGIRVECGETSCIFEFITYKYKGTLMEADDAPKEFLVDPGLQPNNDTLLQPPSMMRSQSLPMNHYGIPLPWPYFIDPQYFSDAHDIHGQYHPPPFRRSNTMGGPHPENLEHLPPSGVDEPNNDRASVHNNKQGSQIDPSHGADSQGRERGSTTLQDHGTVVFPTPGEQASYFRGRGRGVGGRGVGSNGPGDNSRMRQRSSSSGFMSSLSEEEHVTSD